MDQKFLTNFKLCSEISGIFFSKNLDHMLLPPLLEMQVNSSLA